MTRGMVTGAHRRARRDSQQVEKKTDRRRQKGTFGRELDDVVDKSNPETF